MRIYEFMRVWQKDDTPPLRKTIIKIIISTVYTSFPTILTVVAFCYDDLTEMVNTGLMAILEAVATLKLFYLIYKQKEILDMLNDPLVSHSIEDKSEYDDCNRKIKRIVRMIAAYLITLTLSLDFNIINQIFTNDKVMPLFIRYAMRDSKPLYWVSFVFCGASCTFCNISNYANIIIWYIMLNYAIEYELLGNRMKRLGTQAKKITTVAEQNHPAFPRHDHLYLKDLLDLVKAHRHLIA